MTAWRTVDIGGEQPKSEHKCNLCNDKGHMVIRLPDGLWSVQQERGRKVVIGPAVVEGPCVCRWKGKVEITQATQPGSPAEAMEKTTEGER